MTRAVVAALVAALGLALAPCAARAGRADGPREVPARARALAEAGRVYHGEGDYLRAIQAFEEAYAIAPSPGLLFDLAQAHRLAGHCRDAAWMYRRYLATHPQAERAELARTELHAVERCARQVVPTPAAAAGHAAPALAVAAPSVPAGALSPAADGLREQHVGIGLAIGGGAGLLAAATFALEDAGTPSDAAEHAAFAKLFGIAGGLALAGGAAVYAVGWYHGRHGVAVEPRAGGAELRASWRW